MLGWIALGVVAVGVLVLVLTPIPVLRRVPRLMRAAVRLRGRQAQVMELAESAGALQARLEALREHAERTQGQIGAISAKR